MGNCGVGFAPVHDHDHDRLISLMEGVEDIPDVVLTEGLEWNWNSFSDYLNILDNKGFDMSLSLAAKQRSIHNNYSTFLVLFIMLSGHYSFLVYHKYNWLILCLIAIISALGRHYFNLRGRNIHKPSILFTSIIALILLATLIFVFKN